MNQEWHCTSKAIAHNMIVFITSMCDKLKTQVFHQGSSEAIILYDHMPVSALNKVVTFAGKVLFERHSPTSIKPDAAPRDRIDLRTSGQPEERETLNEKEAELFLISSVMQQVLKSPNKSTMIHDLINNYSQKNAARVDYYPVSHRDSEIHAEQTASEFTVPFLCFALAGIIF